MSRAKHYASIPGINPELTEISMRRIRMNARKRRAEAALLFLSGTAFGAALTNFVILWAGA